MKRESEKKSDQGKKKGSEEERGLEKERNQGEQEPMTKNESILQKVTEKSASQAFSDSRDPR